MNDFLCEGYDGTHGRHCSILKKKIFFFYTTTQNKRNSLLHTHTHTQLGTQTHYVGVFYRTSFPHLIENKKWLVTPSL